MTKYRTRLLFALITLIIAVLLGLGIVLGQLFKNHYLTNFNERLENETQMISAIIEKNGGLSSLNKQEMDQFSEILNTSITIVAEDGEILYDNESGLAKNPKNEELISKILAEKGEGDKVGKYSDGNRVQYYWQSLQHNHQTEGYLLLATKVDELKQAYRQLWWILSVSLGMALLVIIMLGSKITSRYTKPIESATNVAIELAKGNYRARTYEDHIDETGMLSASINILARNLQDAMKSQEIQQDRLRTLIENMGSGLILIDKRGYINLINKTYKEVFNVNPGEYLYKLYHEVIKDKEVSSLIEEIFMTEQKIKKQVVLPIGIERRYFEVYGVPIMSSNNVWKGVLLVFHDITELKKLEQVRKDFVANVSHELKTPITSIKGFSETLLDGAMNDKQALEDFLTIILKESNRLQSLIHDLLELTRIEQHGFALTLEKVDINGQVSEVLKILKGAATEKNVNLTFKTNTPKTLITGDADRLKQVFINLITNAITYTQSGGLVSIEVENQKETVTVKIKDTGIGMEKSEIPRIFERFYRIDRARSRDSGGTGLGLAIVKHIMEVHKGTIDVKSEIGVGTTFILSFSKNLPTS